jgi:hypothetical protein
MQLSWSSPTILTDVDLYSKEPAVIAQLAPGESIARFEATWDGKEWQFGRRAQDA